MILEAFGLPVILDEKKNELILQDNLFCQSNNSKNFGKMKNLVYDPESTDDNERCYIFYQNIWEKNKQSIFEKNNITNGITILLPGTMGYECRKNSGHYHGYSEGHTIPFPEVYEVLCGEAVFLIQESHNFDHPEEELEVESLKAVFLKKGEKVIIPPFCAHCVINVGEGPMVFGNLASPCPLHYEPIQKKYGFAVYVLKVENQLVFVPNEHYKHVPRVEILKPMEYPELGISFHRPLYTAYTENPEKFEFLYEPEKYLTIINNLLER